MEIFSRQWQLWVQRVQCVAAVAITQSSISGSNVSNEGWRMRWAGQALRPCNVMLCCDAQRVHPNQESHGTWPAWTKHQPKYEAGLLTQNHMRGRHSQDAARAVCQLGQANSQQRRVTCQHSSGVQVLASVAAAGTTASLCQQVPAKTASQPTAVCCPPPGCPKPVQQQGAAGLPLAQATTTNSLLRMVAAAEPCCCCWEGRRSLVALSAGRCPAAASGPSCCCAGRRARLRCCSTAATRGILAALLQPWVPPPPCSDD